MEQKIKELYERLDSYDLKLVKWIRKTRPTVYTKLEHVSQSGMFRLISVFIIKNNKPICINTLVADIAGYKTDSKRGGLRVTGCGMDMGFAVVYNFSHYLFPTGFKYRQNEHHRNNSPSPIDNNGGYALKQKWM